MSDFLLNLSPIDILGWVANIGFIIGGVLLANKKRCGWLFYIFANFVYALQGYFLSLSSLFVISLWLVTIDGYGFYKWKVLNEK